MQHKINVATVIDDIHDFFRFVIPALGIADHGKTELTPSPHLVFNQTDVLLRQPGLSLYTSIVGMIFDDFARRQYSHPAKYTHDGIVYSAHKKHF